MLRKIGQFTVIAKIEDGNYATVYKVEDRAKSVYALKIARENLDEYNELITREFRVLSQFKHPNIVSVHEYDKTPEGFAFFSLDYVEGEPINRCFREFAEGFANALIQVIQALSAFHDRGFVHGDLKPEHIVYDPRTEKAVLIDFGFAGISAQKGIARGTLGYIAPEIVKGLGADQRSDIYSLGVIICETLLGARPSTSHADIKNVPPELNSMVTALLASEPALRPTLPEIHEIVTKHLRIARISPPVYHVDLPITVFVEIPEIEKKLDGLNGRALIIIGNNGSGKTRYLKELKYRYLMNDCAVLFFIPGEGTDLPAALAQFVDYKMTTSDGKKERYGIYDELLQSLLAYAKRQKTLILIDGVQKLSDYELGLLRFIGYGIENSDVTIISSALPDTRVIDLGFENTDLRALSRDETRALLDKTFMLAESEGASHGFFQWLFRQTGGNPFYITEILKNLHQSKTISYHDGKWLFRMERLKEGDVPHRLEELMLSRVSKLNREERNALQILAFIDSPVEPSLIREITGTESSITLENLKRVDLLREEYINNKRLIVIANQLLGDLLAKDADEQEKKAMYDRICEHVEARFAGETNNVPVLARLCEKAGRLDKAYKYYGEALQNAEKIFDHESALAYCVKLFELAGEDDPEKRNEMSLRIGDLHQILGHNHEAIRSYDGATRANDIRIRSGAYFGLGKVNTLAGDYAEADRFLTEALKILEGIKTETKNYIKIANFLSYTYTLHNKIEDAEAWLKTIRNMVDVISDNETTAETMYYEAVLEWSKRDLNRGIAASKALYDFCKKHGIVRQEAYAANLLGSFFSQQNDLENAHAYAELAIKGYQKIKDVKGLCSALNIEAQLFQNRGNMHKAMALNEKVLRYSLQTGDKMLQYYTSMHLANINEALGKFDRAIELNKRALIIQPGSPFAVYNLSILYYEKNDIESAGSLLRENKFLKNEPLQYIGMALVLMAQGEEGHALKMLNKGLQLAEDEKHDTRTETGILVKACEFLYETGNYSRSSEYAKKLMKVAYETSREFLIASSIARLCDYRLKKNAVIDIDHELSALKTAGMLYDNAYLRRLRLDIMVQSDVTALDTKAISMEVVEIDKILTTLGAGFERQQLQKIKDRFFSLAADAPLQLTPSGSYLEVFSRLADIINTNLGEETFVRKILDLGINATGAERGAIFIKGNKGMEFVAGVDLDRTTIKDAAELSNTAISQMDKNQIVYVRDALSHSEYNVRKSVILNRIHSILCIPMAVNENIVGALYLDSKVTGRMFSDKDKDFLNTVARIIASVIEKSRAYQKIVEENVLLKANMISEIGSGYLVGKSRQMKDVYRLACRTAQSDAPVLITGETGTGKGMLARLVHLRSNRKEKKFIPINCGTVTETLLESELFGYKKGAFTGAFKDKTGLLEEGEGGTIFLDEITNTSPAFQAKILEAIEEKVIRRVGETKVREIDVRFILATNRDLEIEVEEGRFRKDLYYRINVFEIYMPPLRERISDINELAQFFLRRFSRQLNKNVIGFAPGVMDRLKTYYWPGNVRELQNIIERAVTLSRSGLIAIDDAGYGPGNRASSSLVDIKKEAVLDALEKSGWRKKQAAEILGISRKTLYNYMKKYLIAKIR